MLYRRTSVSTACASPIQPSVSSAMTRLQPLEREPQRASRFRGKCPRLLTIQICAHAWLRRLSVTSTDVCFRWARQWRPLLEFLLPSLARCPAREAVKSQRLLRWPRSCARAGCALVTRSSSKGSSSGIRSERFGNCLRQRLLLEHGPRRVDDLRQRVTAAVISTGRSAKAYLGSSAT